MTKPKLNRIHSGASPEQVAQDLKVLVEFKSQGMTLEKLNQLLEEKLIPHFMNYDCPEFHSLYNFFPEAGAELGAKIALHFNQGVTNWMVSPGAVMLEELCCQALCRLFGLADSADATFMYCGTYANQQALYMALHRKAEQVGFDLAEQGINGFPNPENLVIVTSQEAHFSLRHAVRILGLGEQSLVPVPVDAQWRMDLDQFKKTIRNLKSDKDIFCLVSTAGTTSTGSIDPIFPLIEVSQDLNAWLHVDGAYGLVYSLLPDKKSLFKGIEQADSIVWDPHKQFGVPIPSSLLFVRNQKEFERMAIYGEYFNRKDDPEPNPGLKSPPSTRPATALPLVATILHLGLDGIKQRINAPLAAIQDISEQLQQQQDIELCHYPETGMLCLRLLVPGLSETKLNQLQKYLHEKLNQQGKRSISLTKLGDKTVLRLFALTPQVTSEAMLETIKELRALAASYSLE